jgi:ATP-dependent Lhr-like helicase
VRDEAWPAVESPDELHEALMLLGFATEAEGRGLAPEAEAWFGELAAARRTTLLSIPGGGPRYWVTAERLLQVLAVHPQATFAPRIAAPAAAAAPEWSRDTALVELLRARLEGLGPVTAGELAASAQVPAAWVEAALAGLEAEGFALRGRFRPGADAVEWCERRLLARIHRYTLKRLRAEIEPVQSADFVRFLLDWQRVAPASRQEGPHSLAAVVEQLEGFEAAAVAWEHEILPARVADYDPAWLDALCLSGRVVWTRRTLPRPAPRDDEAGPGRAGPVRRTPIALLGRKHAAGWKRVAGGGGSEAPRLSAPAQAVDDFLARHGAAFFDEIVDGARLLRTQVEAALGELVACGLVNSDSFTGLRALLVPSTERRPARGGRGPRRRTVAFGIEDAGRWTRLQPAPAAGAAGPDDAALVETLARVLLRRWGVVFRRLLEREASLPPWRDLLRVYRRLEARGEIRGGRFVAGFAGEQYALPEAVAQLREVRRTPPSGVLVSVCGADPLNLVGLVTPGTRLPSTTRNRLLYRDGVPLAVREAGDVRFLIDLDPPDEWDARQALVRRAVPPRLRAALGRTG